MGNGGRPLKFQSVEDLQQKIDSYFQSNPQDEWTVTGLALALDTYRSVLIDYEERDEFSNAIKKAKEMVHNAYEKDLRKKGRSGDIFALKNFGWRDERSLDHTSAGKPFFLSNDLMNKYGVDSSAKSDRAG